jgi:hypothetical protein
MGWYDGNYQLNPFTMLAGETISVTVELDFSDPKAIRDWSVTAWGDKGAITVRHEDGLASDKLPVIYKNGDKRQQNQATTDGGNSGKSEGGNNNAPSMIEAPETNEKQKKFNEWV